MTSTPSTIDITPDWDGMRLYIVAMHRTHPHAAHAIAATMGGERPADVGPDPLHCASCIGTPLAEAARARLHGAARWDASSIPD